MPTCDAKKPPLLTARLIPAERRDARSRQSRKLPTMCWRSSKAPITSSSSVGTREKKRNPVAPFITSTLQQESSRKLRFSVKRTMMLAQRLYEGIEIGKEGAVGLITYMRTDSTRVSDDAIADVRDYIAERYGKRRSCRHAPTSTSPRRTRRTRTKPSAPPPWRSRRKWWRSTWPKTR